MTDEEKRMTPEEQRRIAAERKRAYRLRKKNEELARQAPKEEQERLFNEQCRNLSPEEVQARIRDDQARMQDSRRIAQATFNPLSKEQQVQAVQQILDSHPELEEQWRKVEGNSEIRPFPPGVLYQDHREQAQAIVSDAEERHRRVELIMSNHNRIRSNPSELMWEILKLLNLIRIEMVDLLGGLKCGTK